MLTPTIPATAAGTWQSLTPSQRATLHRLRHTNGGWSASVEYTDDLHAVWLLGLVRINGYARLGAAQPPWRHPSAPLRRGHCVTSGLTDSGRLVHGHHVALLNPAPRQEWRA